jgi:ribosome-binding factor A
MLLQSIVPILENEINDPRIGFVTLTQVEMSPDMRYATAWVSVLGSAKSKKDSLIGLGHACPYIQRRVGQAMKLRHTPRVRFKLDESLEQVEKIDRLLKEAQAGGAGSAS